MTTRKNRPTDRALREALAPYLSFPKLRQLVASSGDLREAIHAGETPPAEVLALLEALVALLKPAERDGIRSPADAAAFMMLQLGHLDQEHLCVLCLNTRNRIQKVQTVYIGSLNTSAVRVGELYKEAIRLNSASILVVHNHPSGLVDPSPEDVLITRQIVEAGKLLDCECVDHIIVGQGRWVSLRERGLGFEKA